MTKDFRIENALYHLRDQLEKVRCKSLMPMYMTPSARMNNLEEIKKITEKSLEYLEKVLNDKQIVKED